MSRLLLLGASPDAVASLSAVLSTLPREVSIPIVLLVPQRDPGDELCSQLAKDCLLPVEEPDDKDLLVPGRIFVAPADYHLLIDQGCVSLSKEPAIDHQRPSFEPLFETAVIGYGETVAGMILTGTTGRHLDSLKHLQARGGAAAIGWTSEASPSGPALSGIPVLQRDAWSPWVLEVCTSLSLRVRP